LVRVRPKRSEHHPRRVLPALLVLVMGIVGACKHQAEPVAEANPFFADWQSPHDIPDFDRIRIEHFRPAFEAGIEQLREDIAAIRDNPDPPTFANSVEVLDTSGALLKRVQSVFRNLQNTNSSDSLEQLESEIAELLRDRKESVYTDDAIFRRVEAVYGQRDSLGLDQEARRLLELKYQGFLRSGVNLDPAGKARLEEIDARIAQLTSQFSQNLLAATKGYTLFVSDRRDLEGLPPFSVGAARAFARARGYEQGWLFGLNRSRFEDFMAYASNRELRRQVFEAYTSRGLGGDHDNRAILLEIVRLRAERAVLLGYRNHAEYELEPNMARSPQQAEQFLLGVWSSARVKSQQELAELQSIIEAEGGGFLLEPWDWWYYAQKLREQKYALDARRLRPYFELNQVREGAFHVARLLFGVQFVPLPGVAGWHPEVQSWGVYDEAGEFLGVFMADYHARKNKRGGSWKSNYQSASEVGGHTVRPIVTNNFNFLTPPVERPTLLNYRETLTVFHEMGHALHTLLTTARYARYAGSNGSPRDYTEFPAQFMEHYATEPEVLAVYARHVDTGEVMPEELMAQLRAAATHNQGFKTVESIAAAWLDLSWHRLSPSEAAAISDVSRFEREALQELGLPPQIVPRYRSSYFAHIFARGYSSEYYSYLWAETLDADAFAAFTESGDVFQQEWAQRLKEHIYQAGGREDADVLYRRFRGRDPVVEPLLRARGLPRISSDDG
jgi:peptidyl-dipeptidase Dcp